MSFKTPKFWRQHDKTQEKTYSYHEIEKGKIGMRNDAVIRRYLNVCLQVELQRQ